MTGEFPPYSTVTWCPHCHEPIHVQTRDRLIGYEETEQAITSHFRVNHRLRWWLWGRFGWKRAISGL